MGETRVMSQRLDKWLWHARVTKSRTGAQGLIAAGQVRINRSRALRASQQLDIGDILTIAAGSHVRVLKVAGFALRRGPPAAARLLYEEETGPVAVAPDGPAG